MRRDGEGYRTARVETAAFVGLGVRPVTVEVQLTAGLPAFTVVGLPDKAVAESRERVRAAMAALGLSLPARRIVVNLAPADLAKEGSHYDLPIALGLLAVTGVVGVDLLIDRLALGELGLDGTIRPVAGVLPAALAAAERGLGLVCPAACGGEAAWFGEQIDIIAAGHLLDLVEHLRGRRVLPPPEPQPVAEDAASWLDLADVRGQESAKRALEVAAAGGHHLLMIGPPGAGKSMLAQRLPGILPELSPREALEVAMIRSVAGESAALTRTRPFRAPHHGASMAALVGGGRRARPGEVSLAHRGVLFLDEFAEFARNALDALRQPLETGEVTVARADSHITYPARFQLVAAMNPCRCGNLADAERRCTQAPRCGLRYQGRISGPLLDRFDIVIQLPPVRPDTLTLPPPTEGSREVGARVAAARERQRERFAAAGYEQLQVNVDLHGRLLDELVALEPAAVELLQQAAERLRLSARAVHRGMRLARTIADLEGTPTVARRHLAEALTYRYRPPVAVA